MAVISKQNILWLALSLGLTLSGNAHADPALVDAQLPGEIYSGQKVEFKLTLEWPEKEGKFEFKTPKAIDLENFEILEKGQSLETHASDSGPISRLVLIYEMQASAQGRGKISSFNVLYRKPHTLSWNSIQIPSVIVDIKHGLPVKKIIKLTAITLAIIFPFMIWFIRARSAEQKHEKNFQGDPRQQIYAKAAIKFSRFISGYTASFLEELLSDWSSEIMKVIMAYYDIPIHTSTTPEILKELRARNVTAEGLHEIEDILASLERSRLATAEIIKELRDRNIANDDLQEIGSIFSQLSHLKFATESTSSKELEKLRIALLTFAKSKIIVGPSDFTNYMK
jgi:hypothetical protein